MKFLPLSQLDVVNDALNFDTPDCHISGSCDVYTTKAAGGDKKLYKDIDESLESQHAAMMKFGMSLSPPQRQQMAASLNLSRSSPFGPLSDLASRKTFAYLIATLNASHPDYDFSHVLRPGDFKRQRYLHKVIANIDSTLATVRPHGASAGSERYIPYSPPITTSVLPKTSRSKSGEGRSPESISPPNMWAVIDRDMMLTDCTIFSYQPTEDPFDDDETAAIWSLRYFFFNKALKRVAYINVRAVPVVAHSSPQLRAASSRRSASTRTKAATSLQPGELKRSLSSIIVDDGDDDDDDGSHLVGAGKRARYWLGDGLATGFTTSNSEDLDEEDDFGDNHGLVWNRGKMGQLLDDEFAGREDDDDGGFEQYDEEEDEDDLSEDTYDGEQRAKGMVRGMSEEVAAAMDVD